MQIENNNEICHRLLDQLKLKANYDYNCCKWPFKFLPILCITYLIYGFYIFSFNYPTINFIYATVTFTTY